MDQKQKIIDGLPLSCWSSKNPWLIAHNLEQDGDQFFFSVNHPMNYYRCRIPQLVGKHIRGCYHSWMILTDHPYDYYWSLWNPITFKFIRLPRLKLRDGYYDDISQCCLSSPPDHPGSILLLTRRSVSEIVFCRMDRKQKKLRWNQMSCLKQLASLTGDECVLVGNPTCCNGKIYAQMFGSSDTVHPPVQIDVVAKEKEDVINLLPLVKLPVPDTHAYSERLLLKGSCEELFTIAIGHTKRKLIDVFLYKLDMSSMEWIEIKDLKDYVFFVDFSFDLAVYNRADCNLATRSESGGGYIHIIHETGNVISSYNINERTFSLSSSHLLGLPPRSEPSNMSVWSMPESRLQVDDNKSKEEGNEDETVVISSIIDERKNEENLLEIPRVVLDMIMEFCVGMEYLNIRATCKYCRLAAPVIPSNNNQRLRTNTWVSPWLLVLDKNLGITSFTDPLFGDNNRFIKTHQELFNDYKIWCSRYGWLLLLISEDCPVLFNPFTNHIHKLPQIYPYIDTFCFSKPPTSPDCMVVGFSAYRNSLDAYIHFVGGKPSWRKCTMDFGDVKAPIFKFPTFFGRDIYALSNKGGIYVFKDSSCNVFSSNLFVKENAAAAPRSCSGEYFYVKCDQHHLLVIVGEFGQSVEVFKLNETTKEWEKIDNLGKHMIFITDTTCVCMDAKTPEMENKIYFPILHCDNGRIVFYSLETCSYHTFNGRNVEESTSSGFYGTITTTYAHAWIEPTWF